MHNYSEDNLGARVLNWIMIGGAAALFAFVTFASFSPQAVSAPEQLIVTSTSATHA